MTSRVLILTENPGLHSNRRFASEAKSQNIQLDFRNPYLETNLIPEYDAALIRTTGYRYDDSDLDLLEGRYPIFNSPDESRPLRDKWLQAQLFQKNSLPHPETWAINDYPEHLNEVVIKTLRGSKGLGVEFLFGKENIHRRIAEIKNSNDMRYIIQRPVIHFREFRILYSFGEVLGIIEKLPDPSRKEFRRNAGFATSQNKPLAFHQLPSSIIHLLNQLVKKIPFSIVGIDILLEKDKAYILELNLVPGFQFMEKSLQSNIAGKILNQVAKKLSSE